MTSDRTHDVVGIGNALVDVISHEADDFVSAHGLNRGAMTLIDEDRAEALYAAMGPGVEVSGGSAANTMVGIASFGGAAAYLGRVRDDQLGAVFAHDLTASGVSFSSPRAPVGPSTGRCLIVVTPDAQRTMSTYLGVSAFLGPDDVDAEPVADSDIVYLEGYLWDRPEAKEAYRYAARVSHAADNRVSLTLSDSFCVDRHRDEWLTLVADEVDVLFANQDELCSLYQCELDRAIEAARRDCDLCAITMGARGSVIVSDTETHQVDPVPVERRVDTTGAGDLYAAGFLFGLTRGDDLPTCGHLGSAAASEVITHTGAKPESSLTGLLAT